MDGSILLKTRNYHKKRIFTDDAIVIIYYQMYMDGKVNWCPLYDISDLFNRLSENKLHPVIGKQYGHLNSSDCTLIRYQIFITDIIGYIGHDFQCCWLDWYCREPKLWNLRTEIPLIINSSQLAKTKKYIFLTCPWWFLTGRSSWSISLNDA